MTTIDRLQTEKVALLARIEEIDSLINDFRAWERRAEAVIPSGVGYDATKYVNRLEEGSGDAKKLVEVIASHKQRHNQGTPMSEFVNAVADILDESAFPLNRSALLEKLQQVGIDVGGSDPKNTLSARMSRMDVFVNLAGFGYWAKHRDFPPAGYVVPKFEPEGGPLLAL